MTKTKLYLLVIFLYILTPICIMGTLGTMVSKKFEVDESYWHIDGDKELSAEQKEIEKLDNKGRRLDLISYAFGFGALTTFAIATGLIIKRKKILPKKSYS